MSLIPTIRASAQARLKLTQLISFKLSQIQQRLLEADPSLWEKILADLEKSLYSTSPDHFDDSILNQAFAFIENKSREGLQKQIKFLTGKERWIGRHPTKLLQSFIDEHKKLIKSVCIEQLDKISLAIKRGIREGRMTKDIVQEIQLATGMSKKRAKLIARNSVLNYSGAITKNNQIEAGFTKYTWQTSQDERVRTSHRNRNGTVYSWSDPGPHPRTEINCRCDAIPVLEDASS